MNASKEGVAALVDVAQTFPASREHGEAVLTTSPDYFSNQADFWDVVGSGADHVAPFTYGPNFSFVTTEISDKLTPPVEARSASGLLDALAEVQQRAQADLVTQGFAK